MRARDSVAQRAIIPVKTCVSMPSPSTAEPVYPRFLSDKCADHSHVTSCNHFRQYATRSQHLDDSAVDILTIDAECPP